jgi:hypothetical protein
LTRILAHPSTAEIAEKISKSLQTRRALRQRKVIEAKNKEADNDRVSGD